MNFERAIGIWTRMYQHILDSHRRGGKWLFVHYDQLLDGAANSRLEKALGIAIAERFADPRLKRSKADGDAGAEAA